MKVKYDDVIDKAGVPYWYDENGVPRYVSFHPRRSARLAPKEVFLVEIQCQACQSRFNVAVSWRDEDHIPEEIRSVMHKRRPSEGYVFYGDPPNVGCCSSGATMSSEFVRVIEAWARQSDYSWQMLSEQKVEEIESLIEQSGVLIAE